MACAVPARSIRDLARQVCRAPGMRLLGIPSPPIASQALRFGRRIPANPPIASRVRSVGRDRAQGWDALPATKVPVSDSGPGDAERSVRLRRPVLPGSVSVRLSAYSTRLPPIFQVPEDRTIQTVSPKRRTGQNLIDRQRGHDSVSTRAAGPNKHRPRFQRVTDLKVWLNFGLRSRRTARSLRLRVCRGQDGPLSTRPDQAPHQCPEAHAHARRLLRKSSVRFDALGVHAHRIAPGQ